MSGNPQCSLEDCTKITLESKTAQQKPLCTNKINTFYEPPSIGITTQNHCCMRILSMKTDNVDIHKIKEDANALLEARTTYKKNKIIEKLKEKSIPVVNKRKRPRFDDQIEEQNDSEVDEWSEGDENNLEKGVCEIDAKCLSSTQPVSIIIEDD